MTTSDSADVFVWTWLPGMTEPVVAGRLEPIGPQLAFVYARSYRERADAISLYSPELPLRAGRIRPLDGLSAPGCILDGRPDSWGQRVLLNRLVGRDWDDTDPGELSDLTYLIESGSDRVGALDFQRSSTDYVQRGGAPATLEELATSAERVQAGIPLTLSLDQALLHGSSVGGARPKALLSGDGVSWIAKFSATDDRYPVVEAEFVAMRLAHEVGLSVAPVQLTEALGKRVLLVERFDRERESAVRHHLVSALTMLQLDELQARHASYADLAQLVRRSFTQPGVTLRELFARITFNILVGNTDDHARNHAALWDGSMLTLSPAYDLCPQLRSGGEASQGMIIGADGYRLSNLAGCVDRAVDYGLSRGDARDIIDHQREIIADRLPELCDEASIDEVGQQQLSRGAFLLPYAFEGYEGA